jgi:hypothetical protein
VDVVNTDFTGLYRGVDVSNTLFTNTAITVRGSDFVNTMQGITSAGSVSDRFYDNEFFLPDDYFGAEMGDPNVAVWGVYMLRSFTPVAI